MARTQVVPQPVIRSNDDLNIALGEMIVCKGRIDTRKATLEAEITRLRDQANAEMKQDLELFARREHDVQEYAEYNRSNLFPGDRKSAQFPNGVVSFRLHPPAIAQKPKFTIQASIDAIKANFPDRTSWLRTKEELNKDSLLQADPSDLSMIGLRIVQKESFGYELSTEDSLLQAAG